MKNKKSLAVILCAMLLSTSAICVGAETPKLPERVGDLSTIISSPSSSPENAVPMPEIDTNDTSVSMPNVVIEDVNTMQMLKGSFSIVEINLESNQISVKDENSSEFIFNISEDTLIFNSKERKAIPISELKVADSVVVHYSPAMTRSLPPQAAAFAVMLNETELTPSDFANYYVVDEVVPNENGVTLTDAGKNTVLTILKDSPLKTLDGETVSVDTIKAGDKLVAYYSIVTMSLPAQATSNETFVVPAGIKATEIEPATPIEVKEETPSSSSEIEIVEPETIDSAPEVETSSKMGVWESIVNFFKNLFK